MQGSRTTLSRVTRSTWLGLLACGILIGGYIAVSLAATLPKSATADEPLHALAAYLRRFDGDFRLNVEDPPLWGYVAMLPHYAGELTIDKQSAAWPHLVEYMWSQPTFVTQTLYRTPGNDPVRFINRSRFMMALLAAALAVLIATWAWQIAGPIAAVIATTLFCADPTFIGHGSLVKDDVPMTLAGLLCAWTIWQVGRRLTIGCCLLAVAAVGIAVNTKFSGVLFVPIAAALLTTRVWLERDWPAPTSLLSTRWARLKWALLIAVASGVGAFGCIWACYGFRFLPTPDERVSLNLPLIATAAKWTTLIAADPNAQPPSPRVLATAPLPVVASVVLWINRYGLLPQAYLAGFLDTYATTLTRPCFLLGQIGHLGWWYYFPLALIFKLPLATLAALLVAVVVAAWPSRFVEKYSIDRWTMICLGLPVALYGGMALRTHLNLGVRHVLPLCPFLFLLVAICLAPLWRQKAGRILLVILALGLLIESATAFPNDIAFFNAAAGGWKGGIRLLGDSNLDWGQDLPLLQRWRAVHPATKLYVAYFGMADPGYYLADYTALPGNSGSLLPAQWPNQPGVLAIGASVLQGMYASADERQHYASLLARCKLIDVLGGTIYLYDLPAAPPQSSTTVSDNNVATADRFVAPGAR